MRILFVGASTFTGYHFIQELERADHEVHFTLTREIPDYQGIRGLRVKSLTNGLDAKTKFYEKVFFGSPEFIELIRYVKPEVICIHSTSTTLGHREKEFNYRQHVLSSTHNVERVFESLVDVGCKQVILTNSYFSSVPQNQHSFSSYGLAKDLIRDVFQFHCRKSNIHLTEYVIPNPFGPYEEGNMTSAMMFAWSHNEKFMLGSPKPVRDFVHVQSLAQDYVLALESGNALFQPSQYVMSHLEFCSKFSEEIRKRTGWNCLIEVHERNLNEPTVRQGYHNVWMHEVFESYLWDTLVRWYQLARPTL
jgi:UDP-glucose 4-epimerase